MSVSGLWEEPPDEWPAGAPWPPPLFPHPSERRSWRFLGRVHAGTIALADGTVIDAGEGLTFIRPAEPGELEGGEPAWLRCRPGGWR